MFMIFLKETMYISCLLDRGIIVTITTVLYFFSQNQLCNVYFMFGWQYGSCIISSEKSDSHCWEFKDHESWTFVESCAIFSDCKLNVLGCEDIWSYKQGMLNCINSLATVSIMNRFHLRCTCLPVTLINFSVLIRRLKQSCTLSESCVDRYRR